MRPKKTSLIYKILYFFINLFFPKMNIVGKENLPGEACILVGNHSQMTGPLMSELRLDLPHETWCAGQMMKWDEVADYAFTDFWSFHPNWTHWFFRLLSYLVTPLAVCLFNNAHTIPVYHDSRLLTTLKLSLQRLQEGYNILIFPEYNKKYNHVLYDFQDRFIDLAKLYYKKTGKALQFVPLYIAPNLHQSHICEPIRFDPDAPIAEERERIKQYLMDSITAKAESLPEHTVVPYRNIRKRDYPSSRPTAEESA